MNVLRNIFNVWWMQWSWPLKLASVLVVCIFFGLLAGTLKSCGRVAPTLNEQEIQRAQQAIAEQDRREMIDVLAQSDAKEAAADATAIDANTATVNAIAQSKKRWSEASNEELAAELERRTKE